MKAKLLRLNIGIKTEGEIASMIHFTDDMMMMTKSEGDI